MTKKNALSPQHTFDRDISLSRNATSTDKGASYQVNISADWQVFVGPNGGYIAAIILNGMKTESQTMHIATFNIRYDNPRDSGNLWKDRKDPVTALIR